MSQFENSEQLKLFEENVYSTITQLESAWTEDLYWNEEAYGAIKNTDESVNKVLNHIYDNVTKQPNNIASKEEVRQAALEVKSALEHQSTRLTLCKLLKSVSNESYDVAKVLIASYLPLSLAGTITISTTPLVCGLMAFTIARVGISVFCND